MDRSARPEVDAHVGEYEVSKGVVEQLMRTARGRVRRMGEEGDEEWEGRQYSATVLACVGIAHEIVFQVREGGCT